MSNVTIQNIEVGLLEEAPNNPNHMAPADYETLGRLMGRKGFLQPILVRVLDAGTMRVIDGHHRLRAAKALGMPEVACVLTQCTDGEEPLLRIAMNKLRGDLDITSTASILKELAQSGVKMEELTLTGYGESEVADLIGAMSQDIDAAAEMQLPASEDYEVEEDTSRKPLVLEILFANVEDKKKAKRGLKRAAGKGKDLAVGLLRLLGEDAPRKETTQ